MATSSASVSLAPFEMQAFWRLTPPTHTRDQSGSSNANVHVFALTYGAEEEWEASNYVGTSQSANVWARYELDYTSKTHDPHVHIGASQYGYTGDLNNGVETAWYDIAASVTPGSTATLTVHVDGSYSGAADLVDVYVEIVVIVALQATCDDPLPETSVALDALRFYLSAVQDPDCSDTVWWPKIEANRTDVWTAPTTVLDSHADQTGWQRYTAGAWAALPAGGAAIAEQCRYTPPVPADWLTGWWFWRGLAYDGDIAGFGDPSASQTVRLMLAVINEFALLIGGLDWTARCSNWVITQTTMGELGSIEFDLHVPVGSTVPALDAAVVMAIRDAGDNEAEFTGWLSENPSIIGPFDYHLYCSLPDAYLARRRCTADVATQDVGLTLKGLVDTYCTAGELDSSGIDTAIGVSRPVTCLDRSLLDVFKEIASENGLVFWVDATALPAKVYCVKRANLAPARFALLWGQASAVT